MATDPKPKVDSRIDGDGNMVTEIISEALASIPTRVIVVEELYNCGVISEKKMRKRIQKIMESEELKSIEIETLPPGQ